MRYDIFFGALLVAMIVVVAVLLRRFDRAIGIGIPLLIFCLGLVVGATITWAFWISDLERRQTAALEQQLGYSSIHLLGNNEFVASSDGRFVQGVMIQKDDNLYEVQLNPLLP